MPRISYHSAQVCCETLPSGVVKLSLFGLITREGFNGVYGPARQYATGAPVVIARFDTALISARGDLMSADSPGIGDFPAVALVVPADRYERALHLARALASAFGVSRPVFLPEQLEAAHQWAAHVARSRSGLSLPQLR